MSNSSVSTLGAGGRGGGYVTKSSHHEKGYGVVWSICIENAPTHGPV